MELIGKHPRLSGLPLFVLLENPGAQRSQALGKEERAWQMESATRQSINALGCRLSCLSGRRYHNRHDCEVLYALAQSARGVVCLYRRLRAGGRSVTYSLPAF